MTGFHLVPSHGHQIVADVRGRITNNSSVRLDHLLTAPTTITPLSFTYTCIYILSTQLDTHFHNCRTPNSGFGLRLRTPSPSDVTYLHKFYIPYKSRQSIRPPRHHVPTGPCHTSEANQRARQEHVMSTLST